MVVPKSCDVVVVGAGAAGLAAATDLVAAGRDVVVLEAAEVPGGRLATDQQDGFRLDRGFQVLNTSYPQVRRRLDLTELDVRTFTAGALVRRDDRLHRLGNPLRAPASAPGSLASGLVPASTWPPLAAYSASTAFASAAVLRARTDCSAAAAFHTAGLGGALTDEFLRPFLSGVLLEDELATSRRFVDLVWRSFVRGRSVLPARGIGEVGRALAGALPDGVVHHGVTVTGVAAGMVQHREGSTAARAVVVAVDPSTAATWLPAVPTPGMRGVTTYYYATDEPPLDEAVIVLDGQARGPVVNTVVLSAALRDYAPDGTSLISASSLGAPLPDAVVRRELSRLYGCDTARWNDVAVVSVPEALPTFPPGTPLRRRVDLGDGVFVAGDHRDTPSLQGALASGTRAARAVSEFLRG